MPIGVAGIGRMGAAIAERLLERGNEVVVFNRTPAKTQRLAAAGAEVAATPAGLAARCEVVLSLLRDADAIDTVYHGARGLLSASSAGQLFIEMSTVRPATQRSLAAAVERTGASLIDCPFAGSVSPAREGRLFGFAGGRDEDVARARPVLEQFCRRLEHVGPVGSGASVKLAVQLPTHVYWQALGEALCLCADVDLAPAELLDILADTPGAPAMLRTRLPVVAAFLEGRGSGEVHFDIDAIRKDLEVMLEEAAGLGSSLPITERALSCYDEASADGLGGQNAAALARRWLDEHGGRVDPG